MDYVGVTPSWRPSQNPNHSRDAVMIRADAVSPDFLYISHEFYVIKRGTRDQLCGELKG